MGGGVMRRIGGMGKLQCPLLSQKCSLPFSQRPFKKRRLFLNELSKAKSKQQ
jgi:hypothetical protein